jgi:hypothetical protein
MSSAPNLPFVMHGARVAIADGLVHLQEQVEGIERIIVLGAPSPSLHRSLGLMKVVND